MQFEITGSGTQDLRATDLSAFDGLTFLTSGNTTAQINSAQITGILLTYEGSAFRDTVEVSLDTANFDASGLSLTDWSANDRFLIRDTATNNQITGTSANDTITVTAGIDAVNGGAGTDDILIADYSARTTGFSTSGSSFSDFISTQVSFSGIERFNFIGGSGNDNVTTLGGDDTLIGGAGNDTLNSGTGAVVIDGGADTDLWIADFSGDGTAKTINLNLSGVQTAGNGTTYANIERLNVFGGSGNDVITSRTDNANDGRSDTLNGGVGNDTLTVGGGVDTVIGGDGDDLLIVDYSTETSGVTTGNGFFSDFINTQVSFSGIERFNVTGGLGNDNIATLGGNDTLNGGDGNDTLNSGAGNAVIRGGTGTDLWISDFSGESGAKIVNLNLTGVQNAGQGTSYRDIERLNFLGGSGDDVITTRTDDANDGRSDTLNGGVGNDTLTVGGGIDTVIGGDGDDLLIVDYSTDTLGMTTGPGFFSDFSNTQVNFSNIERFDVRGGSAGDSFATLGGNDTLSGGGGNDTLNSGAGEAVVNGGSGADLWVSDFSTDGTAKVINLGLAGVQDAGNGSTYAEIERLNFTGGAGDDVIATRTDNANDGLGDTLNGGLGNDTLTVGGGIDSINGGDGDDLLIVDYSTETLGMTAGNGFFSDFSNTQVNFSNIERIDFRGGAGADNITLGTGDDTFTGGLGNDTAFGGGGTDTVSFAHLTTRVVVTIDPSNVGVTRGVAVDVDRLTGFEVYILGSGNDQATGNTGNDHFVGGVGGDRLRGGAGNDTLFGGGQIDRLEGGAGQDVMSGGNGGDIFEFTNLGNMNRLEAEADIITDFVGGQDKIDFRLIDAIPGGTLDQFTWIGNAAFTGLGQLRFYDNGVDTFVALNTNGGLAADYTIRLNGVLTLNETDFILV